MSAELLSSYRCGGVI